jgi:hypothetical protein
MPSNSLETGPDVGFRINPAVAADWDELLRRKLTLIGHEWADAIGVSCLGGTTVNPYSIASKADG